MTHLSVNLNKIALLRNSRETAIPDLLEAARTCLAAGAHGITVHPRPDQRHIRPSDVTRLADLLRREYHGIEFNIEGNPFAGPQAGSRGEDYPGFLNLVHQVKPDQCTLVPDADHQLTSDHGWDLALPHPGLRELVAELKDLGIRVSLFMDPDREQIRRAKALGVDRIELYTGPYADAFGTQAEDAVYQGFHDAAQAALEIGLGLNAGHDLNRANLGRFCGVPGLLEVSIGHALVSDALWLGLDTSVRSYLEVLRHSQPA